MEAVYKLLPRIFYYLTFIIIILGYIELIYPHGFQLILIGIFVIINSIIIISINTNNLKSILFKNNQWSFTETLVRIITIFTILMIVNSMIGFASFYNQIMNHFAHKDVILMATIGRLMFVLDLTICLLIEILLTYQKYHKFKSHSKA